MTYPAIHTEISFDADPLAEPAWEEIDVQSLRIITGRTRELEPFPPATATIGLDNSARVFDPFHAAGPHYGKLLPNKRIRIYTTTSDSESAFRWGEGRWGSTTEWGYNEPLFHGFVDGWPQQYGPSRISNIQISATDAFKQLNRKKLAGRSVYELEVLDDAPYQWFRFGETAGRAYVDQSGNGRDVSLYGTTEITSLTKGAHPMLIDGSNSMLVLSALTFAPIPPSYTQMQNLSVEFWFTLSMYSGGSYTFPIYTRGLMSVTVSERDIQFDTGGGDYVITSSDAFVDDGLYHVVCTKSGATLKIYINGAEVPVTTVGSPSALIATSAGYLFAGVGIAGSPTTIARADIAELAIYEGALSADRIAAHYEAGVTPWDGESPGTRMQNVLDRIPWPAGLTDLDTGEATLGPARLSTVGSASKPTALEYLQKVNSAEQGLLYVNHKSMDGEVAFRGRHSRLTDTRSTDVQWVFSDDAADSTAFRYESLELAYDERDIVNKVTVTWVNGAETVLDQTSIDEFGEIAITLDTEQETADAARSLGEWVVARYKDPRVRCKSITLNPAAIDANWAPVLGSQISDRATVRMLPQNTGDPIELDVLIEGIEHDIDQGVNRWITTLRCSDTDAGPWFVWGTATWDETTAWAS